jgi:hypothetical protein
VSGLKAIYVFTSYIVDRKIDVIKVNFLGKKLERKGDEVIGPSLLPTTHADKQMIQFIHPVNAIKVCTLCMYFSVLFIM